MRPAVIGTVLLFATTVGTSPNAVAFQSSHVTIQTGSTYRSTVGAPLYAGPNVVIIGGGRAYDRHAPYRYRGNHRHYRPRPRSGYGFKYGNVWRDPYYNPGPRYRTYHYNPYGYGNRAPYPRYGVSPNPKPRRYGRDSGGRGYGRERYDRYPRLTILGATYRSIDGRACDAFSYVHRRCDGVESCSVKASNKICGDPDRGRLKVLEVAYACDGQRRRANVPEKSRSKLRCY